MLILPVDEARAGMRLAASVAHPEHPEQNLLQAGYLLQSGVLRRLSDMGVASVCVECPGLEDLDKHLAPMLSPERQRIYGQIKRTIDAVQGSACLRVSYEDYYASTRDMVTTLLNQGQNPVFLDQISRLGSDAVGHATAVAHLALLLGLRLETYLIDQRKRLSPQRAKDIVNLGVAGMLHDLGKQVLPRELRDYHAGNEPDQPDHLEGWQDHARLGYEMIRDNVEPTAANAVLNHHQHFDGTGFPDPTRTTKCEDDDEVRANKGERIHIFARILQAADLYDRLAGCSGDRQRRSNIEVFHLMSTRYAGRVDPVVLDALRAVTPPFAPGTQIRLSDCSEAIVSDIDPDAPYHPVVRRLLDDNWTIDSARVDLQAAEAPTVTHVGRTPISDFLPGAMLTQRSSACETVALAV